LTARRISLNSLADLCFRRHRLIDRAPHDTGLSDFGVADLAGVIHSIGIET
jgi:hypothetical protein